MGWPMAELNTVADIRGGATPRRDNAVYWDGDIPWVTPTDLPALGEGISELDNTTEAITNEGLSSCSARLLPPGTVLFSSRATIGKVAIAAVPLATNQGFANFIPKSEVESRYLAWCLYQSADRIAGLAGSTTSSIRPTACVACGPEQMPKRHVSCRLSSYGCLATRLRIRWDGQSGALTVSVSPALARC